MSNILTGKGNIIDDSICFFSKYPCKFRSVYGNPMPGKGTYKMYHYNGST